MASFFITDGNLYEAPWNVWYPHLETIGELTI